MSTDRATAWSLTINNPTPSDEEGIALARQRGWRVEGQKEKGAEGTVHYQLLVKTPQVRFSAVKRAFPRAHIEVARNVQALKAYVNKEDTRLSELPTSQDKYPSLSKLWDLVCEYLTKKCMPTPTSGMCITASTLRFRPTEHMSRDESALSYFDDAINYLIKQGYFVESHGVNPQVRSAWKKYHSAIFERSIMAQTARQTDMRLESEVNIPMIEHTNADHSQGEDSCSSFTTEGGDSQDLEDGSSSQNEGYTEGTDSCSRQEDD